MAYQRLTMDGQTYRVRIVFDSLARQMDLEDGPLAGPMLSGRDERDLVGTRPIYQMAIEPDPAYQQDYDALFDALARPVPYHTVTVPYNQTTLTYKAAVKTVRDTAGGMLSGVRQWHGMVVLFRGYDILWEAAT